MFLRKLFVKDYRYYKEKGERLFADGRYAEARASYLASLEKAEDGSSDAGEAEYLRGRIGETGNLLAMLNITEAEHALRAGSNAKARESLVLALELAEDVAVREKAENLMKGHDEPEPEPVHPNADNTIHNCAGCTGHAVGDSHKTASPAADLHDDEEFNLLIQTLPDDLPARYAAIGKKFAYAYLSAHRDEQLDSALEVFGEMLADGESDILLYEMAIIVYRQGERKECERLLRRAVELNGRNALCQLSLVQLFLDEGRLAEAIPTLKHMLDNRLLAEQALIMLGDAYVMQGDGEKAMDTYATALENPALKRAAAERLIPLLDKRGRTEEAAYLIKNYLKGCC